MAGKWSVGDSVTLPDLWDVVGGLRERFDGMSERWQEGEKGEAVAEWLDLLEQMCDTYNELVEELDGLREPS